MIAAFKQTIESLKNLNYGVSIKKMTLGQALSYWVKYVILFAVLGLVVGIGAVVYFAPQIPKLVTEKAPEIDFAVKGGKLTTNQKLPFAWQDNGTEIYIDETHATFKNSEGKSQEIKFADFKEDFSFNKKMVVDWTTANQTLLLGLGVGLVLILVLIAGSIGILGQFFQMALWTVGFWILNLILKKNLKYLETFRFVVVASVPALILDMINFLFNDKILSLLSMAVFVFYAAIWIYRLPTKNK